jgi:hypothetical protein
MKKSHVLLIAFLFSCSLSNAQSRDEKGVATAVEGLRKAMLDADKAALEALTSADLTYGHSNGLIEDKAAFVDALTSGKSDFSTINLTNQTVKIAGNIALVRHELHGEANNSPVNLGILLVWQKDGNAWKLVARQAFKL